MSALNTVKYETKRKNIYLRVAMGHFATGNSHSNYYIDVVSQKARMSEARAVAEELCSYYYADTIVDTILCLDGTEVIGACLADSLSIYPVTVIHQIKCSCLKLFIRNCTVIRLRPDFTPSDTAVLSISSAECH